MGKVHDSIHGIRRSHRHIPVLVAVDTYPREKSRRNLGSNYLNLHLSQPSRRLDIYWSNPKIQVVHLASDKTGWPGHCELWRCVASGQRLSGWTLNSLNYYK